MQFRPDSRLAERTETYVSSYLPLTVAGDSALQIFGDRRFHQYNSHVKCVGVWREESVMTSKSS